MYATFVAADLDSKARCKLACGRAISTWGPRKSADFWGERRLKSPLPISGVVWSLRSYCRTRFYRAQRFYLDLFTTSPARFLLRITRISAYAPASIIYKKSLFFEENVRKICEYQKFVVSLHRICNLEDITNHYQ